MRFEWRRASELAHLHAPRCATACPLHSQPSFPTLVPNPSTLVTVLCDSGQRHVTRFWSREFIEGQDLRWPTLEEAEAQVAGFAAGGDRGAEAGGAAGR